MENSHLSSSHSLLQVKIKDYKLEKLSNRFYLWFYFNILGKHTAPNNRLERSFIERKK